MNIFKAIVGIAAVLTLVLPIDALPDVIPLLGWLDDVLAAGLLLMELLRHIQGKRKRH